VGGVMAGGSSKGLIRLSLSFCIRTVPIVLALALVLRDVILSIVSLH
jgi:hypothetical protein